MTQSDSAKLETLSDYLCEAEDALHDAMAALHDAQKLLPRNDPAEKAIIKIWKQAQSLKSKVRKVKESTGELPCQ